MNGCVESSLINRRSLISLAGACLPYHTVLASTSGNSETKPPIPPKVSPVLENALNGANLSAVHMQGWLGERISLNARNRLLKVDMDPLLSGFLQKPGSHPWIGEHVGKWMHAATLSWANTGDAKLLKKLQKVTKILISAQEADGYLGTYIPEKRFGLYADADWDVWSHKYCLIGLLTVYRFTGDIEALQASQRAADLLIATFPSRRSILQAGTHMGMAATSVLEPIVMLYGLTGDPRYLHFGNYIVSAWDEPGGPAILTKLLAGIPVHQIGNGKSYELLSNLVGLVELGRYSGESRYIEAARNAWLDIVKSQIYPTGGLSQWEHFHEVNDGSDDRLAHVSETCATTTWIQFNLALLELTGEACYGDEIERSCYNHLSAAQHPLGDDWCYFTPLRGRKNYLSEITCCHSSGPRAMALAPQAAYFKGRWQSDDALVIATLEPSTATLSLDGKSVTVTQFGGFPRTGIGRLVISLAKPAKFALRLRIPDWARPVKLAGAVEFNGWLTLPSREWSDQDEVTFSYTLSGSSLTGTHRQQGRTALRWGPFFLAYEESSSEVASKAYDVLVPSARDLKITSPSHAPLQFESSPRDHGSILKTFADAGGNGNPVRVWLKEKSAVSPPFDSVLLNGVASRSRGNALGGPDSVLMDDSADNDVSTYDGKNSEQDWFAVALSRKVTVRRIVFVPGRTDEYGGWFDTSRGKPRIEVKRNANSPWEYLAKLESYPETSPTDPREIGSEWDRRGIEQKFDQPVEFVAVRVIGRPAGGKQPTAPYVTCSELQAFVT